MTTAGPLAETAETKLLNLTTGYVVTAALGATTAAGVFDSMDQRPTSVELVAEARGLHPRALLRVLRCLAPAGVVTESESGHFALTDIGMLLRTDTPGSLRDWVVMNGTLMYPAFAELHASLRDEQPCFERALGAPLFEWLAQDPDKAATFTRAMGNFNTQATLAAVDTCDFADVRHVVDIGGGSGAVLARILELAPQAHGTLFDLPHIAAAATPADASRFTAVGGDFFVEVPRGGDLYVLAWILHDWTDDQCIQILRNIRHAAGEHGRLAVFETLLPGGDEPHLGKSLDVGMLVVTGGRERSIEEYRELFAASGFELTRTIGNPGPLSAILAVSV